MKHIGKLVAFLLISSHFFVQAQKSENLKLENDKLCVLINPFGAELQSILDKKTNKEYIWQGDTTYWSSRSPVMFPIVVRVKDDCFTYKNVSYTMPRVGLALIYNFKKLPSDKSNEIKLEMISDETTLPNYPFQFRFIVTYTLNNNKLLVSYLVENKGKETMYYNCGGHPGINCEIDSTHRRSDYQFSFSKKATIKHLKVANGLVQPYSLTLLDNENQLKLNDPRIPSDGTGMIVLNMPARQIGVGYVGKSPYISVDLGNFPNVNLWAPVNSPFISIEPIAGHHDFANAPVEIDKKSQFLSLSAGQSKFYYYSISVFPSN